MCWNIHFFSKEHSLQSVTKQSASKYLEHNCELGDVDSLLFDCPDPLLAYFLAIVPRKFMKNAVHIHPTNRLAIGCNTITLLRVKKITCLMLLNTYSTHTEPMMTFDAASSGVKLQGLLTLVNDQTKHSMTKSLISQLFFFGWLQV